MIHHPLPCYIRVTVKLARKSVFIVLKKSVTLSVRTVLG
jgi:hypothetical protein